MSGRTRCAVYTRKSSEEGLEQAFNSLDAQREACEAYIKSQAHEGWRVIREAFDDGGHSGGSMKRPALQRLLGQITEGRVDVVVVYKVDRLTRSLADFARIVELFDRHGVSFVSVTQAFNTTTSMGRLTLNVLLSFAQFEREVTGERIRDKIAASKKKGMWMGGLVPLGYGVQDKRLIINPDEAETVRTLFRLYHELGTVRRLKEAADQLGLVSKQRRHSTARPFTRGHLYQLLSNPIYIGAIAHKGATYPGQQDAIIDPETWEAVQRQLRDNTTERRSAKNAMAPSLLAGLAYDESGDRLCPTHASKNGRRYRYYISQRLVHEAHANSDGWRLPARELETAVTGALCGFLRDPLRLTKVLQTPDLSPDRIRAAVHSAWTVADHIAQGEPRRQRQHVVALVYRVMLRPDILRIEVRRSGLRRLALDQKQLYDSVAQETIPVDAPIRLQRRGAEARLVLRAASASAAMPDRKLIALIAQAHRWFDQLTRGEAASVREIARRESMDIGDISRVLPVAFLAPDIVEAILAGRQPADLTAERLKRLSALPYPWPEQRRLLGFSS